MIDDNLFYNDTKMKRVEHLTQEQYDNIHAFKSLKEVYRKFRWYRCNPYWLKRNAKWFTDWKYVQKAFRDIQKANYRPDTIYFIMD